MNDVIDVAASTPRTPEELEGLKTTTMVVYVLQALSFLWGVTAIVGVVINYIKREDARGTVYESHFDWQIRTFWWGLLWGVIGLLLAIVLVGFVVMFVAWIWMIYRVVKGWLKLTEGKPDLPAGKGTPGRGQLYIDDRLVGQADIAVTIPIRLTMGGGIVVGADPGAPVTTEYRSPFEFTGRIHKVDVDVSGELITDPEAEMRIMMVKQ
jgi:uncharacterized membrane protein